MKVICINDNWGKVGVEVTTRRKQPINFKCPEFMKDYDAVEVYRDTDTNKVYYRLRGFAPFTYWAASHFATPSVKDETARKLETEPCTIHN